MRRSALTLILMNVSMARRWCGVAGALAVVGYVVRPELHGAPISAHSAGKRGLFRKMWRGARIHGRKTPTAAAVEREIGHNPAVSGANASIPAHLAKRRRRKEALDGGAGRRRWTEAPEGGAGIAECAPSAACCKTKARAQPNVGASQGRRSRPRAPSAILPPSDRCESNSHNDRTTAELRAR